MTRRKPVIVAIDTGTSALKVGIFSLDGRLRGLVTTEQKVVIRGLRYEQSTHQAMGAIRRSLAELGAIADLHGVAAIVTSVQRGTVVPMREDGSALTPYISWMDRRSDKWLRYLTDTIGAERYYAESGHPIVPVTGITKVLALRENEPVWRQTAVVGTQATHLMRWLGSRAFHSDRAAGSYHFPLDPSGIQWNRFIADACGLPLERLPGLVNSTEVVGSLSTRVARHLGIPSGVPLIAGGGDGQCALVGAGCTAAGEALINIGTAAGVQSPRETAARDRRAIINCAAHVVPGNWLVEGHTQASGAALRWLRDTLSSQATPSYRTLLRGLQSVPPGSRGLTFLPTFNGATAPEVAPEIRAALLGLTLEHDRSHIIRALVEGISLEIASLVSSVEAMIGPLRAIRVAGGASRSNTWMQVLSDILRREIVAAPHADAALRGAAMCAAVGIGAYPDMTSAAARFGVDGSARRFFPNGDDQYGEARERYDSAFRLARQFSAEGESS